MSSDDRVVNSYSAAVGSLEDLDYLSSCDPHLLSQIKFHLYQVKNSGPASLDYKTDGFENLMSYLDELFEGLARNYLAKHNRVQHFEFLRESKIDSFHVWEKLLDCLPWFLDCIQYFKFLPDCQFVIDQNYLLFKGSLASSGWSPQTKRKLYANTRQLLKRKSLLSYKISKQSSVEVYDLSLVLDISSSESSLVFYKLGQKSDVNLAFSSCFQNYNVSISDLYDLKKHLCLEITDDIALIRRDSIPSQYIESYASSSFERSILYFPFLFRPLSLIIPGKGSFIDLKQNLSGLMVKKGCKSGNGSREIDLMDETLFNPGLDEKPLYFVDFFSLAVHS